MTEKNILDKAFEETVLQLIFYVISKYRKIILVAIISGILTYFSSFFYDEKYKSMIVITDSKGQDFQDIGGLSSLFTGVTEGNKELTISLRQIQSSPFLIDFIKTNNLPVNLLSDDYVFPDLSLNSNIESLADSKMITNDLNTLKSSALRLSSKIDYTFKGALTEVTFESPSPIFSMIILDSLISFANDQLRTKVINESEKEVIYLNNQIAETSMQDLKRSLSEVVKDKITTISIAQSKEEYLFKVIEPASYNPSKVYPNRNLFFAIGSCLGIFFSALFYVWIYFKRSPEES